MLRKREHWGGHSEEDRYQEEEDRGIDGRVEVGRRSTDGDPRGVHQVLSYCRNAQQGQVDYGTRGERRKVESTQGGNTVQADKDVDRNSAAPAGFDEEGKAVGEGDGYRSLGDT